MVLTKRTEEVLKTKLGEKLELEFFSVMMSTRWQWDGCCRFGGHRLNGNRDITADSSGFGCCRLMGCSDVGFGSEPSVVAHSEVVVCVTRTCANRVAVCSAIVYVTLCYTNCGRLGEIGGLSKSWVWAWAGWELGSWKALGVRLEVGSS